MSHLTQQVSDRLSLLLVCCGGVGLFGCIAVVAGDIIGSLVVVGYSPISETISDLAAGDNSWIMDIALQLFGLGMIACAVGLYLWNLNGLVWKISNILLGILAIDIIIIALRNVYGDNEPWGTDIHIYLVVILGVLFGLITWIHSGGLRKLSQTWFRFSRIISVSWFITAPIFFLIPTEWNGAYERLLAILLLAWVFMMSWLLLQPYRARRSNS